MQQMMAEEVIEQLESAFKQLVDEGTVLVRESKLKEYRTADGRLTNKFMVKYYSLRESKFERYDELLSELRSMQKDDGDADAFLEETVDVMMMPTVNRLINKLDGIIYGTAAQRPTPRRSTTRSSNDGNPPRSASPQRFESPEREEPLTRAASQETLFQDESSRERHSQNSNNNSKHATRSSCVASGVGEPNQALVNAFLKPKAEVDIFDGDVLAFNRFLRQVEASAFPYCSSDEENSPF